MAIVRIQDLYSDFKDGNIITEPNLVDLIDSCYNYDIPAGGNGSLVYEVNVKLTAQDILDMSYRDGVNPEGGVEILPPPGKGKCYIPAYQSVFASYKHTGDTYVSNPYGSYSTLDIYYPSAGYNYIDRKAQTIASIPLSSDPYSTWPNRCDSPCDELGESLNLFSGKEGLNIDIAMNSFVSVNWAEQGERSLSLNTLDNAPLFIGTNQLLNKARTKTNGTIEVKMWYRIFDIAEMVDRSYPNQQDITETSFNNKTFVSGVKDLTVPLTYPGWDNRLTIPTFADYDNAPGAPYNSEALACQPSTFNTVQMEDQFAIGRQARDRYLRAASEVFLGTYQGTYWPMEFWPSYEFTTLNNSVDRMPYFENTSTVAWNQRIGEPLPAGPIMGRLSYLNIPVYTGPAADGLYGWNHREEWLKTRLGSDLVYGDSTMQNKQIIFWVQDPSDITKLVPLNKIYVTTSGTYSDGTCKRITKVNIIDGGTGYSPGDQITINDVPGGVGEGCVATVDGIDTGGIITSIRLFPDPSDPNTSPITGGWYYQAGTTAECTAGNNDAVLTVDLEIGQWIDFSKYKIGIVDGKTIVSWEDVLDQKKPVRDAWLKAASEWSLSCKPMYLAGDIPLFQIDKYLL